MRVGELDVFHFLGKDTIAGNNNEIDDDIVAQY
jgi:hypothetical protein